MFQPCHSENIAIAKFGSLFWGLGLYYITLHSQIQSISGTRIWQI